MNHNLNQKWSKIIRESEQSGISKDKFCQLNGLSTSQYYYWKAKLKKLEKDTSSRVLEKLATPAFIPIKASNQSFFTIELSNNIKLTFSEIPSGQWVAELLNTMEYPNARCK